MAKGKFYVVWEGHHPGIYDSWEEAKKQITDFAKPKHKAFPNKEEAKTAYERGHKHYIGMSPQQKIASLPHPHASVGKPNPETLAVDAACSGNPGDMEYRGVYTRTGQEIFHIGPMKQGTNNIGEFLALVHGLALLKQKNIALPIYSDSVNAIKWVQKKKCKTLLERKPVNEPIFDLIERAEKWLQENTYTTQILKWHTSEWGEIPADFGRK